MDEELKLSLAKALNEKRQGIAADCPDDELLADYISGALPGEELSKLETHIADCKACLEKISLAAKADSPFRAQGLSSVSPDIVNKAKRIAAAKKIRPRQNLWLAACIAAFCLSFVFKKYFLQCLVAAILLGIKWIAESENMRTLILVLDSWRKHTHNEDEEISRRLSDRNKILK